jgi:hypothetical protein
LPGTFGRNAPQPLIAGEAEAMTTLVQSVVREAPVGTSGFGVILLWCLLGLALSLGAAHFGLDFSNLSS